MTRSMHNRPGRPRVRSTTRRMGVVAAAGVAVIGLGVGIAQAQQGESPRSHALRLAQEQAASMPSAKAKLFTDGVARAFPSKGAAKPAQVVGPAAAPGAAHANVPDARVPGISDLRQAPFAPVDFAVQNSYSAKVKGRWYIAYAGTVGGNKADAGQGGVRVMSADPGANTNLQDLGTFPVAGTTSLKVTAGSGTVITLVSGTGATYTFDLSALSYR
ncbi:MAG TPA: hypothetical protein VHO26_10830 [Propionibacteriaceae bacterium]|nr:hypothetical protein [Propionibacteriaceae bacterium]